MKILLGSFVSPLSYCTITWVDADPPAPEIFTGQDPAVVRVPTFHVHEAYPFPSDCVAPSPAAVDKPDLYVTVHVYCVLGEPLIFTVAYCPAFTVPGSVTIVIDVDAGASKDGVAVD